LDRSEVTFATGAGVVLRSKKLPHALVFDPSLLDGNEGRARSMAERLGLLEPTPDAPSWPDDVVPLAGPRRYRAIVLFGFPMLLALFIGVTLLLDHLRASSVGGRCEGDSDCRDGLVCRRALNRCERP
jgi:hypothetical protein